MHSATEALIDAWVTSLAVAGLWVLAWNLFKGLSK